MTPLRLVLADDHTLVRAGIRTLLESIEGVRVVAETGDGRQALALVAEHQPEVAILDITMPGLSGLEVAERLRADSPSTKVIMLSMHAAETYVAAALRAGATGYLLKESAVAELPLALDVVRRGEKYLSPGLGGKVVAGFLEGDPQHAGPLDHLTPRQREILQMIAEGHSAKEIGSRLGISSKTVDIHRARLMERLGIHDVAGLVRVAIRAGLIEADG